MQAFDERLQITGSEYASLIISAVLSFTRAVANASFL